MSKIIFKLTTYLFASLICIISLSGAQAQTGQWIKTENTQSRLISAVKTIGAVPEVKAAIELQLAQGWHTYWKHPGDAGLPPRFDWSRSSNVKDIEISWPLPTRKREQEIFTVFSYGENTTFPLNITLEDASKDAQINVDMDFMICKDICIPDSASLSLTIPAGEGKPSIHEKEISFARLRVPQILPHEKIKITDAKAIDGALQIQTTMARGYKNNPVIIAYTQDGVFTAKPEIIVNEHDPTRATITIDKPETLTDLNAQQIHIILSDGRVAIEHAFTL